MVQDLYGNRPTSGLIAPNHFHVLSSIFLEFRLILHILSYFLFQ